MVRELHVEDPNEGKVSWEQETEFLHDLVYLGIELPEKMTELQRERLGWVPAERDPAAAAAEKLWDHYHVWAEANPGLAELSPGRRLAIYASEFPLKQKDNLG